MTIRFVSVLSKNLRNAAGILFACFSLIAVAADSPEPGTVAVAGSLQDELGCPGDWQPECASTHLAFDATDTVWQGTFTVPAGSWEYKAALNESWDENYGQNATRDGPNILLSLAAPSSVKFYYDHATHWVTDNVSSVIVTAVGSFQDELGCTGDWQPDCLRSWLQDPDGDGVFEFTASLPGGPYEVKVAIDESWDENYGQGGVPGGANIAFVVPAPFAEMLFSFDYATRILTVNKATPPAQPSAVTIAGSLQDELGCPGDWQPDCAVTHLTFDAEDTIWQGTFDVPAGNWEYKAALNDSWDENYGQNATRDGPNIPLVLAAPSSVKVFYDHATRWVGDNVNSVIATAVGSFQDELGCTGDWQPWCLRSMLIDPAGGGLYTFSTNSLPAGDYEAKVAHNEDWAENYGAGGVPGGPNIPFTVPSDGTEIFFTYDPVTHILTIGTGPQIDSDGDGVPDYQDICPGGDDNVNTDGDLAPDFCDVCPFDPENDADGDGVCGDVDACPGGDDTINADGDSLPDFCDACPTDADNDIDGDGVCGDVDVCPIVSDPGQIDTDGDLVGDACDFDDDNDEICDGPDAVEAVCAAGPDNCPLQWNTDQADFDNDGAGDVCDSDIDNDDVADNVDACPTTTAGEVVDAEGCSVYDQCPCGNSWKNHGAYVRCVAHTSEEFLAAGLITELEKDTIVSTAGMSGCGAKK